MNKYQNTILTNIESIENAVGNYGVYVMGLEKSRKDLNENFDKAIAILERGILEFSDDTGDQGINCYVTGLKRGLKLIRDLKSNKESK